MWVPRPQKPEQLPLYARMGLAFAEPILLAVDVVQALGYGIYDAGRQAFGAQGSPSWIPPYLSKTGRGFVDAVQNGYNGKSGPEAFGEYWSHVGREVGLNTLMPWRPLAQGAEKWETTGDSGDFWEAAAGSAWFFLPGPKGLRGARAPVRAGALSTLGRAASGTARTLTHGTLNLMTPMGSGLAFGGLLKWRSPRVAEALSDAGHAYGRFSRPFAAGVADWLGVKVCFVAGTPIQGQHGAKAIETFKSFEEHGDDCDLIVSRNENEPDGVLTLRRVLRKFGCSN